ncbi:MAG: prepilin-type N-terminal cleavage/methylation domain-containing protein [bacterium]
MKTNYTQSGFTLVETLITIFIFSIIMMGTSLMLKDILVNAKQQYGVIDSIDQARRIANSFVNEIRNVTYGANGSYPLNVTSDTEIIFFSTTQKNDGTISRIRYYILNNILYKGITLPAGSPPSYVGQPETITTLITKMSLSANPLFYYYNGDYGGTGNSLVQPVNKNQIKFVKINLTVLKQLTATSNTTFTVSAGASMRNLKNNLDN